MQVTRADGVCSFFTSILDGPATARGRNEGWLKSENEIARLEPFRFDVMRYHAGIAHRGTTLKEYRGTELRCSLNLNMYSDVIQTVDVCESRGLVTPLRANALRRHLCQANFLNVDTLVNALEHGALSRRETRELLLKWFHYFDGFEDVNLYLFAGNGFMMRRLAEHCVLDHQEAIYFLKTWIVNLERLDYSLLEDLEYFKVLPPDDLKVLITRAYIQFVDKSVDYGTHFIPRKKRLGVESLAQENDLDLTELKSKVHRGLVRPSSLPQWF